MNSLSDSKLPPLVIPRKLSPVKQINSENLIIKRNTLTERDSNELLSPDKLHSSLIRDLSSGKLNSSFLSSLPPIGSNSTLPVLVVNKSTDLIKQNIQNSFLLTNKNKILIIKYKQKRQELFKNLSKETRIVIQTEKKEKVLKMIDKKLKKPENKKKLKEKIAFARVLMGILPVFGFCWMAKKDFDKVVNYRKKISRLLLIGAVVCKALGKFLRSLTRAKKLISLRTLKRFMPKYIRRFKHWIYETYASRILIVIDNYTKHGSITKINHVINFQIKLIQRSIRNFICVMKHRKFALRMLWNKIDTGEKVFEAIQHYYISNYLKEKIKLYIDEKKKLNKLNTFITNGYSESIDLIEIFGTDKIDSSVLRLYKIKSINKLISKAKSEKKYWKKIQSHRFPIITLARNEFQSSMKSILRKKQVSRTRKVKFK